MFEFFYFPSLTQTLTNSFVRFHELNLVTNGLVNKKGILFLSGHFSNWELTAFSYPEVTGEKLNIIAKKQASRRLNKRIDEYRELSGNEIISIGFSLKKIYEKLSKNEIVCFLTDQSAHPDYSVYVNFFGKKVPSFSGPAKIALKLRPVLIFGYGIRQKDYTYDIMFENINYDDLEESSEANIRILSQRISDCMEKIIRENSGQWLWFHKRFKHMKT